MTGKRRFLAYIATIVCLTAVELVTNKTGLGLSVFYQASMLGSTTIYFTGVAVDKFKNGRD